MLTNTAPEPVDDATLAATCRAHGLKATPQRIAILKALKQTETHPGPEIVFAAVRELLPSLSLATVYKTLDALEAHGLIDEVTLKADSKRYDANLHPHHHIVCMVCKAIEDLVDDTIVPSIPSLPSGFQASQARIQILGTCAQCQGARATDVVSDDGDVEGATSTKRAAKTASARSSPSKTS